MKDTTEAFAVLKAIAERERPEIVSFGDSETMHATGIVGWLRGDGRWKLLDGFDPAMSYPERLEIRRQALMSDLFITGVNAISMEGSLHWLDKVGNRIAPVAFGPRKVVIVAGRNKIVADRAQAEERIRTIAAPQNVARHPGFRTPCARHKIHSHTDPRGGTRGLRGEIGTVLHDKLSGEPGRSHRHARPSSNGNGRRRAGTRTRTRA